MGTTETSKNALKEIKGKLEIRQETVMKAIKEIEEKQEPPTNMEIAQHLKWSINRITPRVLELRKKGKLRLKETRKCKVTNRTAMTWTTKQN